MYILGISAFYHDSAACLIKDGKILAAAQEERFTRKKNDESFPTHAINYCLSISNLKAKDLEIVVFYDKPFLKFERILESYLTFAPHGFETFIMAMPLWMKEKIWIKKIIKDKLGFNGKILFPKHHMSHAASAFYPSPFQQAAVLTLDAVGEWATTSYGVGHNNNLQLLSEMKFPHSLGMFYSAFTYYTGFKVNSGEYKVMGLAPYGEPIYKNLILSKLIDLKDDGSFMLNMDYFNYCVGLTMTNDKFNKLFRGKPRKPETPLTQKEMNLARSIQEVTEEIVLRMARHIKKETKQKNLCLAGGVALNCVANGKLLKANIFEKIWIQPASGDAGGALGAALIAWHQYFGKKRKTSTTDSMQGAYLGPSYTDKELETFLKKNKIKYQKLEEKKLLNTIADLIAQKNVIGWFQGRMEFGPRALGARSIIGDARSEKMQETMNLKIKFRESFRPFAPVVLREKLSEYFELDQDSPYMLLVAKVQKDKRKNPPTKEKNLFGIEKLKIPRSQVPAITHVDYSARIQTVDNKNPVFYKLLKTFDQKYNCPVLINTSFNVRGEPIVCTPSDAYRCFMRSNIDYLAMGSFLIKKSEQKKLKEHIDWRTQYELD